MDDALIIYLLFLIALRNLLIHHINNLKNGSVNRTKLVDYTKKVIL